MKFLAHRGLWKQPDEKNRFNVLQQALADGFGLETDIRDTGEGLVISHDMPSTSAQPIAELFAMYRKHGYETTLALNIKADGLVTLLKPLLEQYAIENYFCFDMSVPETLAYRREGMRYFSRESEYEPTPALYADAGGVWMDMFEADWIMPEHISRHLDAGKQVALVSPELHRRPHQGFWQRLRDSDIWRHPELMLCTDYPMEALNFFYA